MYIGFPAYNGDVTPAAVEPVAQFWVKHQVSHPSDPPHQSYCWLQCHKFGPPASTNQEPSVGYETKWGM